MRLYAWLFIVCTFTFLVGCESNPSSPSSNVPFSTTEITVGTDAEAVNGQTLSTNYTGWLYDEDAPDNKGAVFDSTDGGAPISFVLGSGTVIQGWEQGIPGMRVGGTRRLVIPPSLAYGSQGRGSIPPNATLIFEIDLVGVQ